MVCNPSILCQQLYFTLQTLLSQTQGQDPTDPLNKPKSVELEIHIFLIFVPLSLSFHGLTAFLLFPRASPIMLSTSSNNFIPLLLLRVLVQIHGIHSACTCHHPGTLKCDRNCTPDPGESTGVGTLVSGLLGVIGFPAPCGVDLLPFELETSSDVGGEAPWERRAGKASETGREGEMSGEGERETARGINSLRVALIQTWMSILVM